MTSQPVPEMLTPAELPWARFTFVLEPLKVVYVGIPKNACTSLKWLIADLAEEDINDFVLPDLSLMVSSELAIHQRRLFRRTGTLVDIAPEIRRTISPDNGWFVFAAVRDPRARLFSAWQNKMLLHDPKYEAWHEADWYPRPPESADDVVRDFARFVELLCSEPDHPLWQDEHFCKQMDFLRPDLIPYSRIYDVAEVPVLLADLGAHLRAQGVERDLKLRRTNDTVLRVNGRALPEKVRAQIEEIHAPDFDAFAHLWDFTKIARAGAWTSESLQEVRARILLHERIGRLVRVASEERQRAQLARQQLQCAERDLEDVRQQVRVSRRQLKRARRRAKLANQRVRELETMRSTRVRLAALRLRGRGAQHAS